MDKTIRIGIIGCGAIGAEHGKALAQVAGAKIVAACDSIGSRADEYCRVYGAEYATTEPARVIGDPSIDVIYVLTQHDSHAELCVRAAEAGKHVLVEKPLALNVEDCLRVGRAVQRSGITLMTAFKMRYYDLVQRAKGLLPHPIMLSMQMVDNRWPDDFWANDPLKGGGNVLSQGCHSCDLLRYVAGSDPQEVYAIGGNYYQQSGVVDNVCATFKFANGTVASWVQGDCRVPAAVSKFYLQGFDKDLSVTLSDRLTRMMVNAPTGVTETRSTETGFVEENRAFIHALLNGLPAPIDHRDGLYATLMVLQAFASIHSGKPEPIAALMAELAG